jgi:hypothetical protein
MEQFVPMIVLLATVKKVVDQIRFIVDGGPRRDAYITMVAWAVGILVTMLAAKTAWAQELRWGDIALADMNLYTQALAGIALGSTASLAHDFGAKTPTRKRPATHRAAGSDTTVQVAP